MSRRDPVTAATLTLRADLIKERIQMGKTCFWILKDPLARAYYYFSDREFAILGLLNGHRCLSEIMQICARRFAPDYVAPESIVGFLADARDQGLVLLTGAKSNTANAAISPANSRSWLSNPLAIRLPGVNPDRLLEFVSPHLKWLCSPVATLAWFAVLVTALLMAITNFELLSEHIAVAASNTSPQWWLTLLAVVSATKVIHELAHAVACKLMGAECRELGVMLLLGVPCLYCDVSDAWMLRERWKRIVVSLAGIAAELLIASLAIFLWSVTDSVAIRDLCVSVIVVCSVSTVVFNGNPLLRYDGYFVLSDLLGIPNLSGESSSLVRGSVRKVIWSLPSSSKEQNLFGDRHVALATYGVLSGIYRMFVMALIALLIYRFLSDFSLHAVGGMIATAMIAAMSWRTAKPIFTPPNRSLIRSAVRGPKRNLMFAAVLIATVFSLAIPLPRSVIAPITIMPANAHDIVVTVPGVLADGLAESTTVQANQVVAELKNSTIELAILRTQSEVRRLETTLAALQQRESFDPVMSSQIPAAKEQLLAEMRKSSITQREQQSLTIRSPVAGTFFAPPNRIALQDDSDRTTWTGTPLQQVNHGAYLERGTVLGIVGDTERREAFALVRQQEIELISVGDAVSLRLATTGNINGQVTEISASPMKDIPREILASGLIRQVGPDLNKNIYYQVRIKLDEPAKSLAARTTATVQIAAKPASLLSRFVRAINEMFRL